MGLEVALAVVTAASTARWSAPYGRHARSGWGPTLDGRWAWGLWEAPALLVFAIVYWRGAHACEPLPLLFFALWQLHYGQRCLVDPLWLRRRSNRRAPWLVLLLAVGFNVLNASLNAFWISEHTVDPQRGWRDPRLLSGLALFAAGWWINRWSDFVLWRMRGTGLEGEYGVPRGGLFELVSCPNYLGEILQWSGWAVATWSPAGLAFALYSAANLVPRAWSHHRWYRQRFADYPRERRAIFPGLF